MTEASACGSMYVEKVYGTVNRPLLDYIEGTGLHILDVGCGTGEAMRIFRSSGHDPVGITLSPLEAQVVEKAGMAVVVADCCAPLPFEPGSFDVVFMNHVLEHLPDPGAALLALKGLLRGQGRVMVAVPNVAFVRPRLQLAIGRFPYADEGVFDRTHLRFFTFHSIRQLVEGCDYTVQVHKAVGRLVPLPLLRRLSFLSLVDRMVGKMAPNLFGREIIVVAAPTTQP